MTEDEFNKYFSGLDESNQHYQYYNASNEEVDWFVCAARSSKYQSPEV